MENKDAPELDHDVINVSLKDGSIVRINSMGHRDNPNGNGLLIDVDYDIVKLGSLPEDQVFDAMWAEVGPTVTHVLSRDPDVKAGVDARLKARRGDRGPDVAEQAPAHRRNEPGRR